VYLEFIEARGRMDLDLDSIAMNDSNHGHLRFKISSLHCMIDWLLLLSQLWCLVSVPCSVVIAYVL